MGVDVVIVLSCKRMSDESEIVHGELDSEAACVLDEKKPSVSGRDLCNHSC